MSYTNIFSFVLYPSSIRQHARTRCLLFLLFASLFSLWLHQPVWSQVPERRDAVARWLLRGGTETELKQRLLTQGQQKYEEVKHTLDADGCALSDVQDNKLQLAMKGVISRHFHEMASLQAATENFDMNKQNEQQEALQILMPAMQRTQIGPFEGDSLFARVLEQTLDTKQKAIFEKRRLEKVAQRHHAIVLKTVAELDDRLALLKLQREKLVQLMDDQVLNSLPANFERYVGYLKINKIPESELAKFLDAEQVRALKQAGERYQGIPPR